MHYFILYHRIYVYVNYIYVSNYIYLKIQQPKEDKQMRYIWYTQFT